MAWHPWASRCLVSGAVVVKGTMVILYESHQFFQQSELSKCENVVVIGQGNVALDAAGF